MKHEHPEVDFPDVAVFFARVPEAGAGLRYGKAELSTYCEVKIANRPCAEQVIVKDGYENVNQAAHRV